MSDVYPELRFHSAKNLTTCDGKKNFVVIGDGSAGRRYERLLHERGHVATVWGPRNRGGESKLLQDGVIIASPPSFHMAHLMYAVGQNSPILCEGPVTYNIAYSSKYYTAPSMTASNWRFVSSMREFNSRLHGREIVSAHLYFDWDLNLWRPGTPIHSPCYYREGITNINLHEVDLALWMFGPAERVHVESRSTLKSMGMDAYSMMIKHHSGVLTTIQSGWHSKQYRRGVCVQLRDGATEEISWTAPGDNPQVNESYGAVLDTWLDAITNWDLSVSPNLEDGFRAYQAINGVAY